MLSEQDRKRLESLLEDFKHDLLAPESKGHPSLKSCAIGYYADKIEHALPDLRGEFPREAVELLNELAALGSKERFLDITSKAIELSSRANAFERLWNGETEVTGDMVKSRGKPDSFGTTKHRYAVGSVCGTCGRSGEACGLQPGCCLNPHERAYRGCSGCEHFGPCLDCIDCKPADDNPPPKMPYIPRQRGAERRQGEERRKRAPLYGSRYQRGDETRYGNRGLLPRRESQRRKEKRGDK